MWISRGPRRLDYAVSEKIIKSNHSTHKHPAAILELERILVELARLAQEIRRRS